MKFVSRATSRAARILDGNIRQESGCQERQIRHDLPITRTDVGFAYRAAAVNWTALDEFDSVVLGVAGGDG